MTIKPDVARLLEQFAMEGAPKPAPKHTVAQHVSMLVGSVGGDVFVLGDVQPGVMELLMSRRRPPVQGAEG